MGAQNLGGFGGGVWVLKETWEYLRDTEIKGIFWVWVLEGI